MSEFPTEKELKAEERATARATKDEVSMSIKQKPQEGNPFGLNKTYKPSRTVNVYAISPMDILGDHIASEENDAILEEDYQALKMDIEQNGQQEPIKLYRGKIVDGRNRRDIIMELGWETIDAVDIEGNHTVEQLKSIARSSSKGRSKSPTQKAIKAYEAYETGKDDGMTQTLAATQEGSTQGSIGKIAFIVKKRGTDALKLLRIGRSIAVNMKATNKFGVLYNWLKQQEKDERDASKKANHGSRTRKEDAKEKALQYINQLAEEDRLVIKYVADESYKMLKKIGE